MPADEVRIIPVHVERPVVEGDDLARHVAGAVELEDGDVVVVSSSAIATAEGRAVELGEVRPGARARRIARRSGRDPRVVELVLRQSRRVCTSRGLLLADTEAAGICANAGVDRSNAGPGRALPLPLDPDASAERLRRTLASLTRRRRLGVVVSDSHGRALRRGCVGVALGVAGVRALWDRRGDRDIFGRRLVSTVVALGDELASAAQLVMGEAGEGVPAAVVRGVDGAGRGRGRDLVRPEDEMVFRCRWLRGR